MRLKIIKSLVLGVLALVVSAFLFSWLFLVSSDRSTSKRSNQTVNITATTYDSNVNREPAVVMRAEYQILDALNLKLRFRAQRIVQSENIFQTADYNEGIRLELSSTQDKAMQGLLIYSSYGETHKISVIDEVILGRIYDLELKTEKDGTVSILLNDKRIGDFPLGLIALSDFSLGTGYKAYQNFIGDIQIESGNFVLSKPIDKVVNWIKDVIISNAIRIVAFLFSLVGLLFLFKSLELSLVRNDASHHEISSLNRQNTDSVRPQGTVILKKWALIKEKISNLDNGVIDVLFKLQIALSLYAVAKYSWIIGDIINISARLIWRYQLYKWTDFFYYPFGGNIFNYVVLCIFMGFYGLGIYSFASRNISDGIRATLLKERLLLISIFLLSIILLSKFILLRDHPALRHFLVAISPLVYIFVFKHQTTLTAWWNLLMPKTLYKTIAGSELVAHAIIATKAKYIASRKFFSDEKYWILISIFLLIAMSLEPINIAKGPVYLLNEYDIPSETYMDGRLIKNDTFLSYLQDDNPVKTSAIRAAAKSSSANWQMEPANHIDLLTLFSNRLELNRTQSGKTDIEFVKKLAMNFDAIKEFYLKNYYEYMYFNFSRGQMNHIGHVLNPLNEFQLGKKLRDIYLQYDLGYTFLLKWTMDFFGGVSIDNYYKCYIYYVIYFVLFLVMVTILFKNSLSSAAAFAILCYSYFNQDFISLILAPGIIPAIHLFDVFVLVFLVLYLRKSSLFYLSLAILSACAGIAVNKQFGSILSIALAITIFLHTMERTGTREKFRGFLLTTVIIVLSVIVVRLTATGTLGETFPYFITGLFSWPARSKTIDWTIIYIVISYFFLFMLKNERHYLKYIYIMVFLYTQGLFIYFYWSGLSNHLPTVFPFLGLQLILMLYIAKNILFAEKKRLHTYFVLTLYVMFIVSLVAIANNALIFYRQKAFFLNNFITHKAYSWDFHNAKLITTIDPEPIQESIALIQRYSPQDKGIFILSKYDNLLPYLAGRYSNMPFFEMTWHLFSEKESNSAIKKILDAKSEYLFIDTNISGGNDDPWSKIYYDWWEAERISRIGRCQQLQKVFEAVKSEYSLVSKGALLSVYQLNAYLSSANKDVQNERKNMDKENRLPMKGI